MTTIYFVRHAHSIYTPDEYNRPLSEPRKLDSIKLIKAIETIDIQEMYASNYLRAYETIQPIALIKELKIQQKESLNERVLSAIPVNDFSSAMTKVWSDPSYTFEGGESNISAQNRVVPTIKSLLNRHSSDNIIIGTHGNILRFIFN